MQFVRILVAFALISIVNGKPEEINENPFVEVKHVVNEQQNNSLAENQTLKKDELPSLLDAGIFSREYPDNIDYTTNGKDLSNKTKERTFPLKKPLHGKIYVKIIKRKNVNPNILSSTPRADVLSRRYHGNDNDNYLFYTSKGRTSPLTRSFDGYYRRKLKLYVPSSHSMKSTEQKIKTNKEVDSEADYQINQFLLPKVPSEGPASIKFYNNEDDYDREGNNLFYTSKERTYPLTRSFDGYNYANNIDRRNFNSYVPSKDSIIPIERKMKTNKEINLEADYQINPFLLPKVSSGGSGSIKFYKNEDAYNREGNILFYKSKGRTSPLTTSFDGYNYANHIDRGNLNSYVPSSDSTIATEEKIKTNKEVDSEADYQINPLLLPKVPSGGHASIKLYNNEDDYKREGNDLFYTSNGRTYPLTRSFDGYNYANNIDRRNLNSYVPSSDSTIATEQKIKTNKEIDSEADYQINPLLLSKVPSGGPASVKFYNNEDDYDREGNNLFYKSKGRTSPPTRSFDGYIYANNIDKGNFNSDVLSKDSINPIEQEMKTNKKIDSEVDYQTNPLFLPKVPNGGPASIKFYNNEDDYDREGNNLFYTSKGRTYPLTRSFDGYNYVNNIDRGNINPNVPSSDSKIATEQKMKSNKVIDLGADYQVNPLLLSKVPSGGPASIQFYKNEDDDDREGNDLFYTSKGRTYPLTTSFDGYSYANNIDKGNFNTYVSSSDSINPIEQKMKTNKEVNSEADYQINSLLLPKLLGGGPTSIKFYNNGDDYDREGNDLFYTSKGRTYPLTTSFDGYNYANNIDRGNFNTYVSSSDSIIPTEQKMKTNKEIDLEADYQINPLLLPKVPSVGPASRKFYNNEDDYGRERNDLFYTSKDRTFPLNRLF